MKGLDRLVDMSRYRPHLDIQPEPHPRAEHGRLDAQPDSGEERSSRRTCLGEQLDGGTDADGPLDANRRRFTELDLEVVIVRQRRSDDLFLHLTVERDVQFLAYVVLSQVDQRVLLGELGERDVQRALVGGATGSDDRFQGWRGEMVALRGRPRFADRVPDPNFPETPEPADSSRGDRRALDGRATLEYAYSGDLPLLVPVESQKIPHPYRTREHTDVRDLLPAGARSTLKTTPETGPSTSPPAAGSNSVMPEISSSTPAPVIAEPKNTGCTSPFPVCAASSPRSRRYETVASSST